MRENDRSKEELEDDEFIRLRVERGIRFGLSCHNCGSGG